MSKLVPQRPIDFVWKLDKLRIEVFQIAAGKHCLHRAKIGAGANERFIGALAEQKLQRTNDDRFAGAGFSGDRDESRRHLPLEFFHKREILYSQQGEDGGHWGG